MDLLTIVLALIAVGVLLWLMNTYVPMDDQIKRIVNIIVIVVIVLWLMKAFGLFAALKAIRF